MGHIKWKNVDVKRSLIMICKLKKIISWFTRKKVAQSHFMS